VTVVDWVLRDRRTGRIVIAQWPNAALVVWLVASAARALLDLGDGWRTALRVVATLALGWWAVDEIGRGVNPWRRALGTVVLAGLIASLLD
jgi:hypothetical protein